ncbi:MAG: FAD-binding oxidoreductase [Dehalococcoidia bacterium]|nr:FAD-binding oxidoreductase [Dehalococcoidia bacterium]
MTNTTETADVVIIGGGVMGCSIACNLALTAADHGLRRIVLLERDTLGSGSTGRSSAAIRMHYSTAVNAELAWRSLQIFRNFEDIIGGECGYTRTGYLVFAGEEDLPSFRSNIATQQSVGVITDIISAGDAAELAPGFAVDDAAAIAYEPYSGHADASGTAYAYATRARSEGVTIRLQTPASAIETSLDSTTRHGSRVVAVRTAGGERIETGIAVVATGPWTARFLAPHGIDAPMIATRHEVLHFRRPLDLVPHHPGGADIGNRIYFRPEGQDLTLVGNGNHSDVVDDPEVYAQRASAAFIQDVWQRLARRIPPIADAELTSGYAGLYTNTPDSHPVMDRIDGVDGLYLCSGFSGHGFKLSPMVGVLMAELIGNGATTTMDIAPLRFSRFAEGDLNNAGYGFDVLA